jgi:hypothetical protein
MTDIAKRFNCTVANISYICKQYGIIPGEGYARDKFVYAVNGVVGTTNNAIQSWH